MASTLLIVTYMGMSFGPYGVGRLSDMLGNLTQALLWQGISTALVALVCFVAAARHIEAEQWSH